MKKHTYMALSLVAPIAVLTACGQSDVEKQVQPQAGEQISNGQQQDTSLNVNKKGEEKKTQEQLIKEKFDSLNKTIESLNDEVEYYRTFVKNLTSTFSTEEMNKFIDKEWNYKLMINNINFPKNGVLELSDNTFDLVVTEDKVPYSVIPDEMSLKGKLQGTIVDKLYIEGDTKYDKKENLKENNSVVTYSFKDVPNGTTIKLKIDDEFKKELNMDTNELAIKIQ